MQYDKPAKKGYDPAKTVSSSLHAKVLLQNDFLQQPVSKNIKSVAVSR